jgi:hypothetical protein
VTPESTLRFQSYTLIALKSHKNPTWHIQIDVSGPGEKATWQFLFFFFFSQQAEDRSSTSHIELCNILESLPMPAGSKAACVNLENEQVSITNHA